MPSKIPRTRCARQRRISAGNARLTIHFGGHVAVNPVSCRFRARTLTAIVGPNGAGKTTYFNLISGQLKPSSAGQVLLHGAHLSSYSAPRRSRRGIGRAFQLTNVFPNLRCWKMCGSWCKRAPASGLDHVEHVGAAIASSIRRAEEVLETVALSAKRDVMRRAPAARRPAQAGSRHVDRARTRNVHVRRADRRHERGRSAGDPRT